MAKNQFIRARVAGWEKDCIRRKADAAHMTESEFVRRAAMDREVTVIEGMDELLRELRYQGNNLNQLTVMARQGRIRCRDNKLFDQTLLRSSMEAYFDMGGCEYLESRIDATEYGELLPTVDDAVCGLISILDAMNTGDNDRFHLETLHHSKQEIRRILERGGKIDRTVEYAVDDEDEEYEQYHGFSMRM